MTTLQFPSLPPAICVARFYLSESVCLLSERTELVLYILTSCVSGVPTLGKTCLLFKSTFFIVKHRSGLVIIYV